MTQSDSYFFCGIGGSGMLPLASILRSQGHIVSGSDRALDQGHVPEKFDFLRAQGIALFPQDGSGITSPDQILVTSTAVEENVPDVQAAIRIGAKRITRPQLLAQLVNTAPLSIAVGGTSGKSTTTGMIAWILHRAGRDPTVMNGAVMKNFITPEAPFASALTGGNRIFVSEVDESDGSIALYHPTIAVLNNISLDHKSMEELRSLFLDFVSRAKIAVVNIDDAEVAALAANLPQERVLTYSFHNRQAKLFAYNVCEEPLAIRFDVTDHTLGATATVRLGVPGRHNAANALAALSAARACGIGLADAVAALEDFSGLRRRMELVGTAGGVTVIDDFGHNPDKITATLNALRAFPGRLLVMFQPHGYGPLKNMKAELVESLAANLGEEDILIMPDPVYFGGTVNRDVGSEHIVEGVCNAGKTAFHIPDRGACGDKLCGLARPGDRIVVMGARDDSLSTFAQILVDRLKQASPAD